MIANRKKHEFLLFKFFFLLNLKLSFDYFTVICGFVLGPHDVKVRIKAVGICGSDVHHFKVWYSSL